MKRLIARFVFFITGWKSQYENEFITDRCVMIAAPHTSNWDLLYAMAVYWKYNVNAKFFIKNDYTKGVHGFLFKKLGAIGVDRGKRNNLVEYAVELFDKNEDLVLLVPAEATRNWAPKWKKGFYVIAKQANVPISLGFLDYKNKVAGVGGLITASGDFEKDMQEIEDFYKTTHAKYPEKFNKKIF